MLYKDNEGGDGLWIKFIYMVPSGCGGKKPLARVINEMPTKSKLKNSLNTLIIEMRYMLPSMRYILAGLNLKSNFLGG
jgi:hypothetical protein